MTIRPNTTASAAETAGRFVLRSLLGEGAHGQVYLADDPVVDRRVALKILHQVGDPRQRLRFLREAKAAARLRHPSLVAVYESGDADGRPYIAAEFVEGRSLADIIADRQAGPSAFARMAEWVRQLADALAYAHVEKIIHRDVKPANIIIDAENRPRLMDFGLAKHVEDEAALTTEGSLLGSPAYMSPEQARGDNKQIGPAGDQYSLGVVLYELLTGTTPFVGPPHIVIPQILQDQPLRPRDRNRRIPRDLEVICLKCLEKDPAHRYSSCRQLADDLGRWLADQPISARRTPMWERLSRWARNRPVVAALSSSALLLLVGITVAATMLIVRLSGDAKATEQALQSARVDLARGQEQARLALENEETARRLADEAHEQSRAARKLEAETSETLAGLEQEERDRTAAAAKLASAGAQLTSEKEAWQRFLDRREETLAKFDALGPWPRYVELLKLADTAIKVGSLIVARSLLDMCPAELRGWEWDYLMGATKQGVESVRILNAAAFRFSPDGQRLAVLEGTCVSFLNLSDGSLIEKCDLKDPSLLTNPPRTLRHGDRLDFDHVIGISFSHDLRRVALMNSTTVAVWDLAKGEQAPPHALDAASQRVNRFLAFSADGSLIVVTRGFANPVGKASHIRPLVWDGLTGKPVGELDEEPQAIDSNARFVAGVDALIVLASGKKLSPSSHGKAGVKRPASLKSPRFCANGRHFVWHGINQTKTDICYVCDLDDGSLVEFGSKIVPLDFAPRGGRILTGEGIWDVAHRQLVLALPHRADGQWSPDGRRVVLRGNDEIQIMYAPENAASLPDIADAPLVAQAQPEAADPGEGVKPEEDLGNLVVPERFLTTSRQTNRPKHFQTLHRLLLEGFGDSAESLRAAKREFASARQLDSDDPLVPYAYGVALLVQKKPAEALEQFQSATKKSQVPFLPALQAIAWVNVSSGDYSKGLPALFDLARVLETSRKSWPSARDKQQSAEWLGRMIGFLDGPGGPAEQSAKIMQLRDDIEGLLTGRGKVSYEIGRTKSAARYEELQALAARPASEVLADGKRKRGELLAAVTAVENKIKSLEEELAGFRKTARMRLATLNGEILSLNKHFKRLAAERNRTTAAVLDLSVPRQYTESKTVYEEPDPSDRKKGRGGSYVTKTVVRQENAQEKQAREAQLAAAREHLQQVISQMEQVNRKVIEGKANVTRAAAEGAKATTDQRETIQEERHRHTDLLAEARDSEPEALTPEKIKARTAALDSFVPFSLEAERRRMLAALPMGE